MRIPLTARAGVIAAATAICGISVTSRPFAFQAVTPPPPGDAAAEVRALRAELQRTTELIVGAQVATGQLQITERRFSLLQTQLADVRHQIELEAARREKPAAALKSAEESVASGLAGADYAVSQLRAELAPIEQREQALRGQETEILNQLRTEEQRWTALNGRLSELERAAMKTGPGR
jgi:hypothetical protein